MQLEQLERTAAVGRSMLALQISDSRDALIVSRLLFSSLQSRSSFNVPSAVVALTVANYNSNPASYISQRILQSSKAAPSEPDLPTDEHAYGALWCCDVAHKQQQQTWSSMEQEVSRWLLTQLGYNSSADSTLSANCRGNLRGLWEFIIANYKTADSKRHIEHVLARHRKEQEAARRAPEQKREAQERRRRLQHMQKKAAELEQTLASFQVGCVHKLHQG